MTQHLSAPQALAAGLHALPAATLPFAATQAAWRFLANVRITPAALAEPLRHAGREAAKASAAAHLLLVHDWSFLGFPTRHAKADRVRKGHAHALGYDLACALLIDGLTGDPLAPMELELTCTSGVIGTRGDRPAPAAHIDQVLPAMDASRSWNLAKPLVHVIDREADGLAQFRAWDAAGHSFVVRLDARRRVAWGGESVMLGQVPDRLREAGAFEAAPGDLGAGRHLVVARTEITCESPGRVRRPGGKRSLVPGGPLTLSLVVSRVLAAGGRVEAEWLLASNVASATAAEVAKWYALRWRVESFFKLLKSRGQQVEDWQQESGGAVLKRLAVAAMACVLAWRLARDASEPGRKLAGLLARLSGRQAKRGSAPSASAILAGLDELLAVLAVLEQTPLEELKDLLNEMLPGLRGTG